MGTSNASRIALVLAAVALAACPSSRRPGFDAGGAGIGTPCTAPEECRSMSCVDVGTASRVCSARCTTDIPCLAGWRCEADLGACQCDAAAEACDGMDDDCDGMVDEGTGTEVGCDPGQACVDGACTCAGTTCDGACVDLSVDRDNCGACRNACWIEELCMDGACCAPSTEICDGVDNDCDGDVDESWPDCGIGEACTGGACVCPTEHTCGGACVDTDRNPRHCGGCGTVCDTDEVCGGGVCCNPVNDALDLLVMVDGSNSMAEEQGSLAAQLPRLVSVLATGDLDGDGSPEFPPVRDLNVGVVTADMGTGGFMIPTCLEPSFGDDGLLRTRGNPRIPGCTASYPRFLSFVPGASDPGAFAADFGCVATVGTGGCGFEQQLESVLKAITPSTSSIRFGMGTVGHGDGPNAGFLRPDTVLAVLVLTDEEDCSAVDPELFNPATSIYAGDLNLRCFQYPSALHLTERYVDGLLALRDDPGRLVFALIAGIPTDLVADPDRVDYDAILRDDRMREMVDTTEPTRLVPSCNVPGRGIAFPPRRMVRVAQSLEGRGATAVVQSICQADFGPAMYAILTRLADTLGTSCR